MHTSTQADCRLQQPQRMDQYESSHKTAAQKPTDPAQNAENPIAGTAALLHPNQPSRQGQGPGPTL